MSSGKNTQAHATSTPLATTRWQLLVVGIAICTAAIWLTVSWSGSNIEALLEPRIGDRVYQVIQQDTSVGYLHTHTGRDAQGNWVMTQHLNINMLNAPPYVSEQRQVFAKAAPHKLLAANLDEKREHQHQIVRLTATETGYTIVMERDGDTEVVERQWEYSVVDQLHLEQQLAASPTVGSEVTERYLDIPKLKISQRRHRVIASSRSGYTLQSVEDASTTELDSRLRLTSFYAPHQFRFELTQSDPDHLQQFLFADTAEWTSRRAVAPLTKDLRPEQTLKALTLTLKALGDNTLLSLGLPRTLRATQQPQATDASAKHYLTGTLTLPVDHPQIAALLEDQPSFSSSTIQQLSAGLIDLTRSNLAYAEHRPAGSVLRALERGYGECVDFADLLTTLARSQNIPTRTVYGIAYSTLPTPGFRFHAWNEILFEEHWHALDPTWNQVIADATHISLDDQTLAALASAMQAQAISLTPTQTSYET
ncbi:MAG: transglutaminase domain-containing protein [Pseudomonadota bacterium]|nr:transglutaminase domain-containing protein [Pseudomonadota bacterium]